MDDLDLSRCQPGECPADRAGFSCPRDTRNHPFYCHHHRQDPARWDDVIVATARADAIRATITRGEGKAIGEPIDEWAMIPTAQLVADSARLAGNLPPEIDMVVAIVRSGLLPGSIIATHLHLPLWTVSRHTGVGNPGHGTRLENKPFVEPRHILLIDDTVAHGNEMTACLPIVRERFPEAAITRAVVYANPMGLHAVDRFVSLYPGMHYLEWNWCNAGHGAKCGYDFDGILCRDFTSEECSSPDRYREAMATITPLFLPRRTVVPLVVTARHESTRDITCDWLARHGIQVDRLVMRDWGSIDDHGHDPATMARWKGEHYAASGCLLFAESDPTQAEAIARFARRPVLCPSAGRVFSGQPSMAEANALLARVDACPDRGRKTGCKHAVCNRHHREVHITECLECVGASDR